MNLLGKFVLGFFSAVRETALLGRTYVGFLLETAHEPELRDCGVRVGPPSPADIIGQWKCLTRSGRGGPSGGGEDARR